MEIQPAGEDAVTRYVKHFFQIPGFSPRVSPGHRLIAPNEPVSIFILTVMQLIQALQVRSGKYKVCLLAF